MALVQRYDASRLDRAARMPSGALRVDATPTRTGVLLYRRPDGSTIRELRHPSEVFSQASLDSLRAVPLTVDHPSEPVTPENWRVHAVGHIGDNVRPIGSHVGASVIVDHAPTVDDVLAKRLVELSCGYTCELDHTPGEYNGEHYDAIQRNITYNHVAALAPGRGRAGPSAAMHLDSKSDAAFSDLAAEGNPVEKETIDGIEYDVGSAAHVAALRKENGKEKARADVAEKAAKALTVKLADATDPKKLAAATAARSKLVADCKRVLAANGKRLDAETEAAAAGGTKTPAEIMRSVVEAAGTDTSGWSDDTVAGFFLHMAMSAPAAEDPALEPLDTATTPDPMAPPKLDARDSRALVAEHTKTNANGNRKTESVCDAILKHQDSLLNMGTQPLAASSRKQP